MPKHRPYLACSLRTPALLAVACCLLITGCHGSMRDLDREVAKMIAQRQKLTLGEHGVSDASAGLPNQPSPAGAYDEQPKTYNPAAGDLPATAAKAGKARAQVDASKNKPIELDLPVLLGYAIKNAPEYRQEKERLFLATFSLVIERHAWGPRFFNTLSSDVSGTPESGDYNTALDLVNDFTLTQRLPYGGTASVSALVNYTNLIYQSSTSTADSETQTASVTASLDLPLLRGAGKVAREDLIQAERNLVYAARDFERFRRSFFVEISNTYFSLLQQQRRIENQQQQVDGLKRLADEQQDLVEKGRIPRFEADDAEAQVLFGQSNLASVKDRYASALDSLKLRIGMPVTQRLQITRAEIKAPSPALNAAKSIQIGQRARLDLQNRGDQIDDAKRAVAVARNQLRGDLDLTASLDLNSTSKASTDGLNLQAGDSDYRVGFEYSLPLDRKIELARYRSSLVDLERAKREYRTQKDRVALDIRDASREIKRATLTLELQSRNVSLAERRLENVKILRRRGNIPPRRLIEAERDLLDARNSRDQARADLQTSILNYLLQTGQMRVDAKGKWVAPGKLVPKDAKDADDAKGAKGAKGKPVKPVKSGETIKSEKKAEQAQPVNNKKDQAKAE